MSNANAVNRRILIDTQGAVRLSLSEDKDGKKLFAEGKIGQCDVPTANGRVYTRPVMEREISRLQEKIKTGSLLGNVDHPGDGKGRIMDAGHIVRGLWMEKDGSVHGKFEIVEESDAGRNLAAFLRRGASIGMSSRGLGSTHTNESGQEVVGEDFKLSSYDFVCDPAVSSAYPQFFTEDKDVVEQVTVDALRAKFPKLVRSIEESAHEVAKQTTLDTVRSDLEGEVEEALKQSKDQLKESLKAELLPEIIKESRDDFAAKLVRALQTMRKEVEEAVRSEFASDPSVAGAKLTLESVAKLVSPFAPPADVKQLLGEKDKVVAELKAELEAAKKSVTEAQNNASKYQSAGVDLGFRLYVEQKLAGRDDAADLKKMIGDTKKFSKIEDLQAKVTGVIKTADDARSIAEAKAAKQAATDKKLSEAKLTMAKQRADKLEEEKRKLEEEFNKKFNELSARLDSVATAKTEEISEKTKALYEAEQRIAELEKGLTKAVNLVENFKTRTFAEKRATGHPNRKAILDSVDRGHVKTKAEINKLAEELEIPAEEPGGVSERVRRFMSRGRESTKEEDRKKRETLSEADNSELTGLLEGTGVSVDDLLGLSGIDEQK